MNLWMTISDHKFLIYRVVLWKGYDENIPKFTCKPIRFLLYLNENVAQFSIYLEPHFNELVALKSRKIARPLELSYLLQ